MARLASKPNEEVRKGAWAAEEDEKLRKYVERYGTGHWRSVGKKAGLQRCGKSCRLRWTNYLRPDIRHGSFTLEEEDLIIKLHAAHGSRWSLIAAQMSGRTDNDIKNHWNTRLKKKLCDLGIDPVTHKPIAELLRDLAQSSGSGNLEAEEAARRCFRDPLVSKAVRECGRNNTALANQFMNQSINVEQHHQFMPQIHIGNGGIRSANDSGSPIRDESSSSEESLSRHSPSPPLSSDLDYSNQRHNYQASSDQNQSLVVESSGSGIEDLSLPQMQHVNEANLLRFTESGINSLTPFQEPASSSLRSVACELYFQRKYNQFEGSLKSPQLLADYARRMSVRSSLPLQEEDQFLNAHTAGSSLQTLPLSRFSSQVQNHTEVATMQGSEEASIPQPTSVGSKLDIRINFGYNNQQQGSVQESFDSRSPLISPTPAGNTSALDITPTDLFGYNGQFSSSIISPNNANLSSFSNSLAATPTGGPRMVLWDYQC